MYHRVPLEASRSSASNQDRASRLRCSPGGFAAQRLLIRLLGGYQHLRAPEPRSVASTPSAGGSWRYIFSIHEGETGLAGSVGFVFDKIIRRNNIQKMRSLFMNARGQVCVRDMEDVINYVL